MPSRPYRIFETKQFAKDLTLPGQNYAILLRKKLMNYVYPQLTQEPHFGINIKRLRSWEPATWRYRIGDWRFFYEIDEKNKIVFMTAAAHRKEAYR